MIPPARPNRWAGDDPLPPLLYYTASAGQGTLRDTGRDPPAVRAAKNFASSLRFSIPAGNPNPRSGINPYRTPQRSPMEDNELVNLARTGDGGAIRTLYQRHARRVFAVVRRMA